MMQDIKRRTRISFFFALGVLLMILTRCSDDWLDVNTDPNHPQDVNVGFVFPAAVLSVSTCYGGVYNLLGGFWAQYWAQSNTSGTYRFIDSYDMEKGGYYYLANFDTAWSNMYAEGLRDLQYVLEKSVQTDNWQYRLMSSVMLAFCFNFMTDLYGEIPYAEALHGDSPVSEFNPAYDTGKDVYLDLIRRIDEVLENVAAYQWKGNEVADFIFQGDKDQWVRFANTLKLKMCLRMAYAEPDLAKMGVEALYASNANFLDRDAKLDIFNDIHELHNPLFHFDRYIVSVSTNLRVSEALFRYFEQNSDPRLSSVCEDEYDFGEYAKNGMPQGGFDLPSSVLDPYAIAVFNLDYDDPVYFISEVESYLLQAEAIARGWGTGEDKYYYDLAITTDFSRKGLTAEEVAFISPGGAYEYPVSGILEEKLKVIAMAKWAAMAGSQGLEAFFESIRSGYPEISMVNSWENNDYNPLYTGGKFTYSLSGVTEGVFPRRMIYPYAESDHNENFPGQTRVTDKIWWDKKTRQDP